MRKLLMIIALLFIGVPLTACDTLGVGTITNPSSAANLTKADEQAAVTAELSYKLWRQTVEIGINAGIIKGELAGKLRQLDLQLYSALTAVERAYAGANATELTTALTNFNNALSSARSALPGGN